MMMIALNSLASSEGFRKRKEGVQGRKRSRKSKKWRPKRNSDARHGRFDRSLSVRGSGYEWQYKIWTEVWGSTPQEGQRRLGISHILSLYEWRKLQKDERSLDRVVPYEAREVCLFRCYLRVRMFTEENDYELGEIWNQERFGIGNSFSMKELDSGPIDRGGKNDIRQVRRYMMEKPRLKDFFLSLIPERKLIILLEGFLDCRALARYWKQIRER